MYLDVGRQGYHDFRFLFASAKWRGLLALISGEEQFALRIENHRGDLGLLG